MRGTGPQKIAEGIYRIGGPELTDNMDSCVYLLDFGELLMIDTGVGAGVDVMVHNIRLLGFDPEHISGIILTHCHMDHVGGAAAFRDRFGIPLIMHALDAEKVERGDNRLTAAFCFGIDFKPLKIDRKLYGTEEELYIGSQKIVCLHTPGHSSGSISAYLDRDGTRVLFAQDIATPLLEGYDCDPQAWWESVEKLESLNADILCDGHSGAYGPNSVVKEYLRHCKDSQQAYLGSRFMG